MLMIMKLICIFHQYCQLLQHTEANVQQEDQFVLVSLILLQYIKLLQLLQFSTTVHIFADQGFDWLENPD